MSVTLSLFAGVGAQFLDNNGTILSGGLIYTYTAGTTTPLTTYTTNLGTVAQPNPIVLDSAGRIPGGELWLTTGYGYKFVTKDSNGVLIGTYDNVPSSAQPPITNDASNIAYEQGAPTTAGSFVIGDTYLITSIGTTNFQTIGAVSNTVGVHFIATGIGSGTGTAQFSRTVQSKLQDVISVKDFGAVGDGIADDTLAIQNAFNWAVYQYSSSGKGVGSVYIPAGNYLISDTLQMSYGDRYTSLQVYGDGPKPVGETKFSGTVIIVNFNDRPAIAVNGGRSCSIKDLSILGLNESWVTTNNLGISATANIDELAEANWSNPAFPSSATSRYAPYAGVAIDPYAGSQPAVHYPNVTFPSWTGITTQYGKNYSSDTLIENVQIYGFVVGVVNQPSNADGNGDFTKIVKCTINQCVYAIAICNTQSRLVRISDCILAQNYTAITTSKYGVQIGNPQIYIDNTNFDNNIYWVYCLSASYGGVVSFTNCYAEGMYSIGTFTGGGGTDSPLTFNSCYFYFQWNDGNYRGTPIYMLNSNVQTTFSSCAFYDNTSLLNILSFPTNPSKITFENTNVNNIGLNATKLYEKSAINSSRSISCSYNQSTCNHFNVYSEALWDLNTGTLSSANNVTNSNSVDSYWRQFGLSFQANIYAQFGINAYSPSHKIPVFTGINPMDRTFGSSISQTGKVVTYGVGSSSTEAYLTQKGGDVGDLIVSGTTGIVYFVSARTALTLTLVAQTGFDSSGNLVATETLTGLWWARNCRVYAIYSTIFGDYTSASPTITNVVRGDSYSGGFADINYGLQINDYMCVDENYQTDPLLAQITGLDTTAQTITLNSNLNYTQVRTKLPLFIRQSPANNT